MYLNLTLAENLFVKTHQISNTYQQMITAFTFSIHRIMVGESTHPADPVPAHSLVPTPTPDYLIPLKNYKYFKG